MKTFLKTIALAAIAALALVSCKDDLIEGNKFEASLVEYTQKVYNEGTFSMTFSSNHEFYVTDYRVEAITAEIDEESFYDDDVIHVDPSKRGDSYETDTNKRITFTISGRNKIVVKSDGRVLVSISLCSKTTGAVVTFQKEIEAFQQGGISISLGNANIPSKRGQEAFIDENGVTHQNIPCIVDGQSLSIKVRAPYGHRFHFTSIRHEGFIPATSEGLFGPREEYVITSAKGEYILNTNPVEVSSNRLSDDPIILVVSAQDLDTGAECTATLYLYAFSAFRPKIRVKDEIMTDGQPAVLVVSDNRGGYDTTGVAINHSLRLSQIEIGNYADKAFDMYQGNIARFILSDTYSFVWDTPSEPGAGTMDNINIQGFGETEIYSTKNIQITDTYSDVQLIGTFYDSEYSLMTAKDTCYFTARVKPAAKAFYLEVDKSKSDYNFQFAQMAGYKEQNSIQEFIIHTDDVIAFNIRTSSTLDSPKFDIYWDKIIESCPIITNNTTLTTTNPYQISGSLTVSMKNIYPTISKATERTLIITPSDSDDLNKLEYRIKFIVIPSVWLVMDGTFVYKQSCDGETSSTAYKYDISDETIIERSESYCLKQFESKLKTFSWAKWPSSLQMKAMRANENTSAVEKMDNISISGDKLFFTASLKISDTKNSYYYYGVNRDQNKKNWSGYRYKDYKDKAWPGRAKESTPGESSTNSTISHTLTNGTASISNTILTILQDWDPIYYGAYYCWEYWPTTIVSWYHHAWYNKTNGTKWNNDDVKLIGTLELSFNISDANVNQKVADKKYWIIGILDNTGEKAWWNPLISNKVLWENKVSKI